MSAVAKPIEPVQERPILSCPLSTVSCNDIRENLPPWCADPWDSCTGNPPFYHPLCGGIGAFRDCFVQCADGAHIEATRGATGCWVQPCAPGTKWCDATCDCQHDWKQCSTGEMTTPGPIPAGVGVADGVLTVDTQATLELLVEQLRAENGGDEDALDEFEASVGHYSYRRYLNDLEDEDEVDLSPNQDFLFDSFLETILSPDGKILIGSTGYTVTRYITYELQNVTSQSFAAADVGDLSGYTVVQHTNDPTGGGDRRNLLRRNLQTADPCDGWQSCKADTTYNNGNRKFRGKIWVRNLPFYASVGTRTKHYRKKSNGKWKRERADYIYAAAAIAAVDLNCENETPGAFSDNKENRKSVQESRTFWNQITRAHEMIGVHAAEDNGSFCQRDLDLFDCVDDTLSCDPPPTPTPAPTPSCMAGSTGVVSTGEAPDAPIVKAVKELEIGDEIYGLDDVGETALCTVEAMGYFGQGPVYGNYTENHFVVTPDGNAVFMHGQVGLQEDTDKYALLTSCPVGTDESGTHFTPLDTDFFGEDAEIVSWSDYVRIHKAILLLVRASGGFWFNPSTYTSMSTVKKYTPDFYKTMLQCIKTKDSKDCDAFEHAAEMLVENSVTDEKKALAKSYFSFIQNKDEGATASARGAGAPTVSISAVVSGV